jgi:hypothetical protein
MGRSPDGTASTGSTEGTVEFPVTFQGRQERHQAWYKVVRPSPPDNGDKRDASPGGTAT